MWGTDLHTVAPLGQAAWGAYSKLSPNRGPIDRIIESDHVHTAIDMQSLAGDVTRLGRCEICDGMRDVLNRSQAAERHLCKQRRSGLLIQHTGHVRRDKARRDDVDRDTARADLARKTLAEADHPGLGGGVVALPRIAHYRDYRRDVVDAPVARLHHPSHHRLAGAVDRAQVGLEHGLP